MKWRGHQKPLPWWAPRQWFGQTPRSEQRGQPVPLSPIELRPFDPMALPPPDGNVYRTPSPEFTRPRDSERWWGGYLASNPIGAGVVFTRALPIHQDGIFDPNTGQYFGQTAQYVKGLGIVWGGQTPINDGAMPAIGGPLLTPAQVYALFGDTSAAAVAPEPIGNLTGV